MAEPFWLSLAECDLPHWQQNRAALDANQPGMAARLETHRQRRDIEIQQNETNIFRSRHQSPGGAICPDSDDLVQTEINTVCQPIAQAFHQGKWLCVVMGCGAGWYIGPLVEYLERNHRGEPKGLVIVEHDPGLLTALLGCVDLGAPIESGRLLFATGPDLAADCMELWDVHHLETLDEQQVSAFPGYDIQDAERKQSYQEVLQSILRHHKQQRDVYFELLRECEAYWSNPKPAPECVWTHITDDRGAGAVLLGLVEGFRRVGLNAQGLRLTDRLFTRFYRSAYDFYQRKPDLMLCVNHSSNYVSWFAQQAPTPRLVWYVDHPKNTVEFDYHSQDRLLLIAENFRDEAQRRGGKVLGVLPVGAPDTLVPPPKPAQWRHTVSYVGSVIDHTKILSSLPDDLLTWIGLVTEEQLNAPMRDLRDVLAAHPIGPEAEQALVSILKTHEAKARYMSDRQLVEYFLYGEANSRRRLRLIEALAEVDSIGVYGPPAWKALLPDAMKAHYRGRIETADELQRLYRESKINLSIIALQGFGFLNPRVFEVPAAGGFLLAEWTPGLDGVYQRDEEMIWFHDVGELDQQITTYSQDDAGRFGMIVRAQKRIVEEHTYSCRAKTILEMLDPKEPQS